MTLNLVTLCAFHLWKFGAPNSSTCKCCVAMQLCVTGEKMGELETSMHFWGCSAQPCIQAWQEYTTEHKHWTQNARRSTGV
jgi:hypothetical protein